MGSAYQKHDQEGLYFLTFQVVGWVDVFTRQEYKDIVIDSFKYCINNKGMELFAYVVMSNHVHVIMRSSKGELSDLVRDFKKHTSKALLKTMFSNTKESRKSWMEMVFKYHAKYNKRSAELQFWTHENHAVELDDNNKVESKINYIHHNPVRAGWVYRAEDYIYSSASNYAGIDNVITVQRIH